VTSTNGMTADFYPFDMKFLSETATRIINEVKGVDRVVYDVTSKPPGTFHSQLHHEILNISTFYRSVEILNRKVDTLHAGGSILNWHKKVIRHEGSSYAVRDQMPRI
jgi:hypothetical protein